MNKLLIQKTDKENMFDVLINFHNQIKNALEVSGKVDLSKFNTSGLENIIITGLGGSAIGGDLIRSYTNYEIKFPISVNRNYTLPAFANKNTLVIVSSYSGNTEETISVYKEAIAKKCRIICLTSGGTVEKMANANKNLYIKLPGGLQPRCALGYSFFSLITIFEKLGFISEGSKDIGNTIKLIEKSSAVYSNLNVEKNPAIKIATAIKGKLPIIYSSVDTLDIVNLRWRGQFSENAKILAYGNFYPEMNHNELVGWNLNKDILKKTVVIFLKDKSDNDRVKLRMKITKDIIKNYCNNMLFLESDAKSRLERIFDLIYLGDWVSYYLAILNNTDPTPVEAIEKLKVKLISKNK
jgi:glucose/mannose-6-phosphate isomerase